MLLVWSSGRTCELVYYSYITHEGSLCFSVVLRQDMQVDLVIATLPMKVLCAFSVVLRQDMRVGLVIATLPMKVLCALVWSSGRTCKLV